MYKPLTKIDLMRQIKKFLEDPNRGISKALFAELCGVDVSNMVKTFEKGEIPLSEMTQIRVNKGYESWKRGEVKVMQRKNASRYVDYRKVPEPVIAPSMGLKLVGGEFKLRVGMVNRHDYSQRDLNGD